MSPGVSQLLTNWPAAGTRASSVTWVTEYACWSAAGGCASSTSSATPESGGHYKEHDIERWMHHLVTEARIAWHGTHVLRKTCGTRIADGGGGVAAVASHLRHKSLQTASRYIDRRGAGLISTAGSNRSGP